MDECKQTNTLTDQMILLSYASLTSIHRHKTKLFGAQQRMR